MRRLLSVAPVLLWLITPLAFAQLPGITASRCLAVDKVGRSRCRRWCSSPR
ncbi:hypothetical protein ACLK14_11125 [Escherichia coli]